MQKFTDAMRARNSSGNRASPTVRIPKVCVRVHRQVDRSRAHSVVTRYVIVRSDRNCGARRGLCTTALL
jgi:hypothetical protein